MMVMPNCRHICSNAERLFNNFSISWFFHKEVLHEDFTTVSTDDGDGNLFWNP